MPAIVVEDLHKAYRIAERRTGAFAGLRSFVRPRYRTVDALAGISFTLERRELVELVTTLDLAPLLDVPVRQLSLGQRMRCDLAAALVHAPDILFLDEPTIGLDAVSKLAVRRFIRRVNQERGLTVILTTHDM